MRNSWHIDFRKPYNIFSTILGLGGIFFGWYITFIYAERPSISVHERQQIVYDHAGSSSSGEPAISVLDRRRRNQVISSNIYSNQVTIWNSGNARLDAKSGPILLRDPFTISIGWMGEPVSGGLVGSTAIDRFLAVSGSRILTASIVSTRGTTRSDLALETTPNKVVLKWKRFDPGDAVRILVVYTANAGVGLINSVSVAGMNSLNIVSDNNWLFKNSVIFFVSWCVFVYSFSYIISAYTISIVNRRIFNHKTQLFFKFIVPACVGIFIVIGSIFMIYFVDPYSTIPILDSPFL